jgi:four helix bundle protein
MYKTFRDMPIWQSAMDIAVAIYKLTDVLPRKEDYGFTSQVRRSALSISANIAEAFGRRHTLEKIHFYYVARGSLTETQSHMDYGRRVDYISTEDHKILDASLQTVYQDLNKIILYLKADKDD